MRHLRSIVLLFIASIGVNGCERDSAPVPAPAPRSAEAVFTEWRGIADQDKRQHLAEEMIRDGHLTGMTREQVVQVLGKPNSRRMSAAYGDPKYIVGPSLIDDMWLCIHVEDGKVTRAELRSD
jgi:hypothetical protein